MSFSHAVCHIDDVKPGKSKKIVVDGDEIVLFNVNGEICAIANVCPHQKFRKLHEGMFENGIVTCPMHGWAYDVRTGISTNASGKVKTFNTEVKNRFIYVIDPLNH